MVANVMKCHGRIDILVNDAAINKSFAFNDFANLPLDNWEDVMSANLTGPMLCSRAVAPIMQKQECGRIINIASLAGLIPNGSSIPYCISKAGLIHLTRCLAVALAPHVLVNCVAPGFIVTAMTDGLSDEQKEKLLGNIPSGRLGTVEDIAGAAVFLASDEASYMTGQTLHINGGMAMI